MGIHGGALVLAAAVAVGVFWPTEARAQHVGVVVGVHHGHGYGPYPYYYGYPYFYSPFYAAWWYQYPYPYPYPPYYYQRRGDTAEARLEIKPRNAQVYVDGYYMGTVDDFDGTFQRLELPGGDHELVVYLKGYRTLHQRTFFRPGQTYHFKSVLEPLGEGEQQEPPPQPPPAPPRRTGPPEGPGYYPPQGGERPPEEPGYYPPRGGERPMPPPERGAPGQAEAGGFGTLSIRVQPSDAVVTIDGDRWDSPEGGSRLMVQLAAGRHHIEVSKDGFTTYTSTVEVHGGENQSLNVSLPPGGGGQ